MDVNGRKLLRICLLGFTLSLAVTVPAIGQEEPSTPSTPAAEPAKRVADDEVVELPAPVSVPVDAASHRPAGPPPTARERAAARLAQIGRPHLAVVRARVTARRGIERHLPEELHWGSELRITTELELEVLEAFCAPRRAERLLVYHIGGTLADGRREYTSLLPRDLGLDDELVLILRELHGEYFLELGERDLLRPIAPGRFRNAGAQEINLRDLEEICP